ncbi:hypothetical protein NPIL_119551 [Nephila pilipes]|uniref:Uncharacterized protein n=1 Tax=Nephila pilipes TaxID=299642 RepID=A0A8X6NW63_NEPPI|nr:hypothetical protein NPIL_119551 [Nephila pilipes]
MVNILLKRKEILYPLQKLGFRYGFLEQHRKFSETGTDLDKEGASQHRSQKMLHESDKHATSSRLSKSNKSHQFDISRTSTCRVLHKRLYA